MTKAFCQAGLLLLAIFLLTGCAASGRPQQPPNLLGQSMLDGKPHAGVTISAWPVEASRLGNMAPFRSAPSDDKGRFGLVLPEGRYYLFADGDGVFAYYGRNPVAVSVSENRDISIGLVRTAGERPEGEPFLNSGVMANLSADGTPLAGATLYAYLDLTSELKGMGYVMVGPSDDGGLVEAELPAGTYYLLARKRLSGQGVGPLRSGDFVGYYPGNPVRIESGKVSRIHLPLLEVPEKVDSLQASLFGGTTLQGVIVNAAGIPVSGARAVLYRDAQMLNRPLAVSQPTAVDGEFIISIPDGGTYFLAGRNTIGGAPGPGELFGTYDGTPDHSLKVERGGSLKGLEIIVEEMW
ncbi:MAG: hypothetical protein C0616_07340 [Desulfuromonas sp.]|nr:MAG: hypothetical protein C0616_07340 [Desulfuromonas sp.]